MSYAINTNLICSIFPHFVRQHKKPSSSPFHQILTPILVYIHSCCKLSFHSSQTPEIFPQFPPHMLYDQSSCSCCMWNSAISGGHRLIYSPLRWCLFSYLNCIPLYLDIGFYQFPTAFVTNCYKYSSLKHTQLLLYSLEGMKSNLADLGSFLSLRGIVHSFPFPNSRGFSSLLPPGCITQTSFLSPCFPHWFYPLASIL